MIWQCTKMALKAISSNRMRAFLTMLGIIVGVLALVVLVSLVTSAGDAVTAQVEGLGTDMIRVSIVDDGGRPLQLDELSNFTDHPAIDLVAPVNQISATARFQNESGLATITGTIPSYAAISNLQLISGRFLHSSDVANNTHVAVISEDTAISLFGTANVVDAEFSLQGRPFRVVGVLENQETLTSLLTPGYTVYIPFTTAVRMSEHLTNAVTSLLVSAYGMDMNAAEDAMDNMLMNRFHRDEDAFSLFNQAIMGEAIGEITNLLAILMGSVAAISLFVGGIGIMNIMMVSVTERTKEIGVRKAIGASRFSIMLQFLIEALIICLIGSIIGVFVSWCILQLATSLFGNLMSFHLSSSVVSISIFFSISIGLTFGLYPANQASRKKPIDALRYDG